MLIEIILPTDQKNISNLENLSEFIMLFIFYLYLNLPQAHRGRNQIITELFKSLLTPEQLKEVGAYPITDPKKFHHHGVPEFIPPVIENSRITDRYQHDLAILSGMEPPDMPPAVPSDLFENSRLEYLVLAAYCPIQTEQPASFIFFFNNLRRYAGHLIRKTAGTGIDMGPDLVLYTCIYLVDLVIYHETFHYYCDYKRKITGAQFNRLKEEGLAVAYSHSKIRWVLREAFRPENFKYIITDEEYKNIMESMHGIQDESLQRRHLRAIHDTLVRESFNDYRGLPGYQDWQDYLDNKQEFYHYIKNNVLDELLHSGVPVDQIQQECSLHGYRGVSLYATPFQCP